jgi:NH3-dependent NAD+ synthetase
LGTKPGVAEENIQPRIRSTILHGFSKFGYIVLTTGNKSELATGHGTSTETWRVASLSS